MEHAKKLGLAIAIVGALIASAEPSSAGATTLTCTNPPGTRVQCPAGTVIKATSDHVEIHAAPAGITCTHSFLELETSNAGSSTETVKASVKSIDFTGCGDWTLTVLAKGSFEFHTHPSDSQGVSGWGTVTSTGLEITATHHIGLHCVFKTNSTDIGTLTGSTSTGGTPILNLLGNLPRTGGTSGVFCGSSAQLTGAYAFISPTWLDVDHAFL